MTTDVWIWQPRQVTGKSNREERRDELKGVRSLGTTLKSPGIFDPIRDGSARPALAPQNHGLFFMPNLQTGYWTSREASRDSTLPRSSPTPRITKQSTFVAVTLDVRPTLSELGDK
ncbi:hypothetical protein CSOJ01_15017 [Colletotrichum sojae]|uniref:Uncharacterized protein n=1 Tax=Colletotrichum sojae TaxID=2175907 RepID=A0A8H6MIM8_9PEZI|nr:hypothetical protein CSOJ01_15017 [Colletotrichum sojae]